MNGRLLRAHRRGTTLLELVVAIVITAVMATIGTSAFAQLSDRRHAILAAGVDTERASAVRALLREWLTVATITPAADLTELATAHADPASNEVYFTTTALVPGVVPGSQLRLYVDDDPETPERGLSLEHRRAPGVAWQRRQLDEGLTRITIELFDATRVQWVPARAGTRMRPAAVRLRFPAVPARGARLWQVTLTIPMLGQGDPAEGGS